ncbi:MAG: SMP-30/gluconolactonase/LRE family protein, partial [Acetobacteraceae bacterium]|nr:SMP-30/gluconolactonase/LRE family protein [Acetobacteraceae bacterium]
MWSPASFYPDPAVQVLDPSFAKYRLPLAAVERLATGLRWAEGPVWFGDARHLLVSDIPNNRIVKWDEETGQLSDFRKPSQYANGNTRDLEGRLVTCEHGGRRVTRTEHDGQVTVLVDRFEGKRLNSPNDVVVRSDGSIWFTDPPFGLLSDYEGDRAEPELPQAVYRFDPAMRRATMVEDSVPGPNGLAFSPDEKTLYLVASRAEPREILAYDVQDGIRLANRRVLINAGPAGTPDGFRLDEDGNLWCGWGMGTP